MTEMKMTEQAACIAQRVYELSAVTRRNDLSSLMNKINRDRKNFRDVFEYGLLLCSGGIETVQLEKILLNLISQEQDKEEKLLKKIQKEAVMHIQKGLHPKLFLYSLFPLLHTAELDEIKGFLEQTNIIEDFNSIRECGKLDATGEKQEEDVILAYPFECIKNADPSVLLEHLRNEQPKTIAYVLAAIEPKKASFILSNLPAKQQSDIAYRIAVMDSPNLELICNVLQLEKKLLSLSGKKYAAAQSAEFEKVLKTYLLRQNAVAEAKNLYEQAGAAHPVGAAQKTAGSGETVELTGRLLSVMRGKPVDFIITDPVNFLNMLNDEHPKTIACILSVLEPPKAAIMLQQLSPRLQCDVASRIALMDDSKLITPDMRADVAEISREDISRIEKNLSAIFGKKCTVRGGIKKITDILCLTETDTFKCIMEFLEKVYPDLIEPIRYYIFVFEDIVILDDRAIQKVLREVYSGDLAIALKNTDERVREKIFSNMSKRAAIMLKEDIECLNSVSPEDSEEAKKKIVAVIRHLEETGEIVAA
ncbi:MAG: hypothetical protein LBH16_05405 [Treponema sp.]|jgi:flagellar motor switch protein FliG|nr:hypothetical protein [Treponema sp.]